MTCCAVLLAFLAGAPALLAGGHHRAGEDPPSHRLPAPGALVARRGAALQASWRPGPIPYVPERDRAAGAACTAEVCQQPRLVIPGLQPAIRGSRTEAVLAFLSRSSFEPVARAARFVADRNLRVDFYPASGHAERGWGHLVVSLRWRLGPPGD